MNAASSFSSQGALIPTRQVLLIEDEALFARSVGRRLGMPPLFEKDWILPL